VALAIIAVLPLGAAAQGTSAASISGVVTDNSGAILPGVAIEVSSPRADREDSNYNHQRARRVPHRRVAPGHVHRYVHAAGLHLFRREGIELTSNFDAAVNADMRLGAVERASPFLAPARWSTHGTLGGGPLSRKRFSTRCRLAKTC
jgi:hypothetical protein